MLQVPETCHGFTTKMKLEAVDKKNPDLTCVASINNVIGDYFLVHFDEWDDTYDYWCTETSPYLHPTGWCRENGIRLTPPQGTRCLSVCCQYWLAWFTVYTFLFYKKLVYKKLVLD